MSEQKNSGPLLGPAPGKLECSFCGKGQQEVRKLIVGREALICDECTALCHDIMVEELEGEQEAEVEAQSVANRVGFKILSDPARHPGLAELALRLARECRADPSLPKVIADVATTLAIALDRPGAS